MKSTKKKNKKHKTTSNYKLVEQTHYCVDFFSHGKSINMCNLHQSVPYAEKESCLACKQIENE